MHQWFKYTLLFIVLVLIQELIFNQLQFSVYINPLIYVAFILLLPMRTKPIAVLMCGLLVGLVMDLSTGMAGANTIASLLTAYARLTMMKIIIGKDNVTDGGIPAPNVIGYPKFLTYVTIMIFVHSLLLFGLEVMTWKYFGLTLLRTIFSTAVTVGLTWLTAMFLSRRHYTV